jgi:hypothetical protein
LKEPNVRRFIVLFAIWVWYVSASNCEATLVLTFANNDPFEDDNAGDTAGPFTDAMTGFSGMITTSAVLPDGGLNPNAGSLGVNAAGSDTPGSFDPGESWSFSWDVPTEFAGIGFGAYNADVGDMHDDQFSVRSDDWISLLITPGSSEVMFDMSTGTFTFDNVGIDDDFSAADLGGAVPVDVGTLITISFTDLDPGGTAGIAHIASLSFNITGIPEPSAFLFGGLVGVVVGSVLAGRRLACKASLPKSKW